MILGKQIYFSSLITDKSVQMPLPKALAASSASEQLDEILYPPVYWQKEALKYFRFSSILMMSVDRCSKRRLPGLVSSLYSCQLTHPHYITIRLPLKVILPEHNQKHNQNHKLHISQTVNSHRICFLLP